MVTDLVTRARNGDQQAWDALVERYAPLIWSICRRHRLAGADADDVGQGVWLQLAEQLDRVRDPAALPGWLATTTRRLATARTRPGISVRDAGELLAGVLQLAGPLAGPAESAGGLAAHVGGRSTAGEVDVLAPVHPSHVGAAGVAREVPG